MHTTENENEGMGAFVQVSTQVKPVDNTIYGFEEIKPSLKTYGSFYCAYQEDGSAFVWVPRWTRTKVLPDDEKIKKIVVSGLEAAPLQERIFVAKARVQWCNHFG